MIVSMAERGDEVQSSSACAKCSVQFREGRNVDKYPEVICHLVRDVEQLFL